jgi:hypothetical protein
MSAIRQIRPDRCYRPRSGGQAAWLSVRLHVPRCDLALGRTPGLPRWPLRDADKATGSNFPSHWGKACPAWSSGHGRAREERSSDRPLTVGVDVGGRHAAPEARLEWQTRRGRGAAYAGHGPVPTTARPQARWPERSQMPQAGARARSALAGGPAGSASRAVNPGKCGW